MWSLQGSRAFSQFVKRSISNVERQTVSPVPSYHVLVFERKYSVTSENKLFDKILIANRGEIACRVIRTARNLGIKCVAVYSEADSNSMHVSQADESYLIGPAPSKESYLRGEKIIEVAKRSGAQAIHPGYGFLSENAEFADLCEREGIVFIGPPSSAIRAMGSKSASKNIMGKASVPQIPGYHGEDQSVPTLLKEADKIGYPILIKAVMGGGGKGMRIVEKKEELEEALNAAKREAMNSFGDDKILIEKYLIEPRHVEFQVFADKHGNVVYLNERDCSVQRRYQKVLEEAPAPNMRPELRKEMGEAAVSAARAVGYVGAGTVEFILDSRQNFYFMEMNTRLQVEHPITEMITKQDLVEWQLKVAANRPLPLTQEKIPLVGHAFEARIYAENPDNNFLPGTGKLVHLSTPNISRHVRIDTGVRQGDEVSVFYDPMIAKLVVWDSDRDSALNRMKLALEQYKVIGLANNVQFLKRLVTHPEFQRGNVETGFITKHREQLLPPPSHVNSTGIAIAALSLLLRENNNHVLASKHSHDPHSPFSQSTGKRLNHTLNRTLQFVDGEKTVNVQATYNPDGSYELLLPESTQPIKVSGKLNGEDLVAVMADRRINATVVVHSNSLHLFYEGERFQLQIPVKDYNAGAAVKGSLLSPMPGRVVKILVKPNDVVTKGAPLMMMEAMKMEHTIRSPVDGVVERINYNLNDLVEEKKQLLSIKETN